MNSILTSPSSYVGKNFVITITAQSLRVSSPHISSALIKWNNGIEQKFQTILWAKSCFRPIYGKHVFIILSQEIGFYHFNQNRIIHVIDDMTQKTVCTDLTSNLFDELHVDDVHYFPATNVLIYIERGGGSIWWFDLSKYDQKFDEPHYYNQDPSFYISKTDDRYAIGNIISDDQDYSVVSFDTKTMKIDQFDNQTGSV